MDEKPSKQSENQQSGQTLSNIDSLNSSKIIAKYNADINWDTLSFTYQIQEKYLNKYSTLMAIKANGVDIIKLDSSYYLKISKQNSLLNDKEAPFKQIILFLKISKNQLYDLSDNINLLNEIELIEENGCFIFKLDSISSYDIKLLDEENINATFLVDGKKGVPILKGSLIDYHLYEKSK
ncbi:hypothetical protein G9H64_09960 [Aquirufa nivalisilvae]|uniref:hypothetical protein n=1 Tax=Aquirufa nivalisilvae TaxID=2516557 RepID=UPI0022A9AFD7|nr:hypothetical protein [Aquirufa nivalisilvae]MCZ2479056.1 hypothetical protein [Aquirufa nivalisilvae]MCZ2483280.1 hypothetical protein [Aquirufa nivalisilvae]